MDIDPENVEKREDPGSGGLVGGNIHNAIGSTLSMEGPHISVLVTVVALEKRCGWGCATIPEILSGKREMR